MEGQIIESVIDTTRCLQWEVTKQRFKSSIGTPRYGFSSPVCDVNIGSEISQWNLQIGNIPDGKIGIGLQLRPGDVTLKVEIEGIGVKTETGYWSCKPVDFIPTNKMFHKIEQFNGKDNVESRHCVTDAGYKKDFLKLFHKNKITVMATLRFYVDRNDYIEKNEREKNFLVHVRSISDKLELSDFTVVCGERQFKCHRVILASMSTVLEAMLLNGHFVETKENSITIEHSSPDIVEAMLEFMYKGDVPANIVEKAIELVVLADKYDLKNSKENPDFLVNKRDLIKICESSMVNNMTVENVLETLIAIDLHVPKSQHRQKIIDFIKNEADQLIKNENWKKFVQKYPDLVTEIFLSAVHAPLKVSNK